MLNFDRVAATKQYYTGPAVTTPNSDHFFMFVVRLTDIAPSSFHYVLSAGTVLAANSYNFNINGSALFRMAYYGASANVDSQFTLDETSTWLVVAQREGNEFNCYAGKIGEPVLRRTSVSAASLGGVTLPAMRIGGRADGAADRWLGGALHQMAYGTGALTISEMNRISNGDSILDLSVTTLVHYRDDTETGNAPATLVNLANPGTNNATLTSGTPTSVTNPTYGDWIVTRSGTGVIGVDIVADGTELIRSTINITSTATGTDSFGIRNNASDNVIVDGAEIYFNAPTGHAVSHGFLGGSAITAGEYLSINIRGPVFASNTPHAISLRQATNAIVKNCRVRGLHVGLLMSLCTDATTGGNIFIDQNGPALYMKGVTNANPSRDIVIQTGAVTIANNGLIAAVHGEGTDCTAGDFSDMLVIVMDPSKIKAFAQIGGLAASLGTPQPVTMTRITFVTVDTWDPESEDKFIYTGNINQAPNRTWSEWQALTETVDNQLEQYPAHVVREMINDLSGGILSRGSSRARQIGIGR